MVNIKKKQPKKTREKTTKTISFLGYNFEIEIKKIIKEPKVKPPKPTKAAKPLKVKKVKPPKEIVINELDSKKEVKNTAEIVSKDALKSSVLQSKPKLSLNTFLTKQKENKKNNSKNKVKNKRKVYVDRVVNQDEETKTKDSLFILDNFRTINSERDEITPFFKKSIGKSTYEKMKKMNTSDVFIKKWQMKRMFMVIAITVVTFFMIAVFNVDPRIFPIGILLGLGSYYLKTISVNRFYTAYKFNRNLEFFKFARLIYPYLRQAKKGTSIYYIFNQMLDRMENPIDRQLLQRLMLQITDRPNDIEPYKEFAERMSGTDFAETFMTLIYDISQGATDDSIIDELGKEVSAQLMDVIHDIVEFKERRFLSFPSLIVAPNMILILGYMVCVMIYQFAQLKF